MRNGLLPLSSALLLVSSPALAERTVSLPFTDGFDQNNYADLVWTTNGATHLHDPDGGWAGGAARFTSTVGAEQGYSGLGSFFFEGTTQLNVRFLIYHGSTFREYTPNNKLLIFRRYDSEGNQLNRPMIITREYDSGGGNIWETYGACDNTVCNYQGGDYWPDGTDEFRIGDAPNREEEWISVELEANASTGLINLYIHTQDGELSGLYVTQTMSPGGVFRDVDILGGYFGAGGVSDANNYFKFDELRIETQYIGPPAGFADSPPPSARPSAPSGLSVISTGL